MSNKNKERSIYEVLTRLFEIIKYMPEAERKELPSAIIANMSEAESRQILPGLIANISESKRWELLEKLEKWQQSKLAEMRDHPRRPSFIPVECSSDEVSFTDFIQDIGRGGAYIQTDGNFYVGQLITLTFSLHQDEEPTSVRGKVVRMDPQGIGVKFEEVLPRI
ncbi:MAG: PilZ domain-containing protein [Deltaproteobacteria bacterium]|nr:PilZ domain-containing protein [Deltaproteobacteria bacterium]